MFCCSILSYTHRADAQIKQQALNSPELCLTANSTLTLRFFTMKILCRLIEGCKSVRSSLEALQILLVQQTNRRKFLPHKGCGERVSVPFMRRKPRRKLQATPFRSGSSLILAHVLVPVVYITKSGQCVVSRLSSSCFHSIQSAPSRIYHGNGSISQYNSILVSVPWRELIYET